LEQEVLQRHVVVLLRFLVWSVKDFIRLGRTYSNVLREGKVDVPFGVCFSRATKT
jgi:hypothetical protein